MKALCLATALLLATASPGWSEEKDKETDKELQALFERAAPIYKQEFNKLVEAGELEPNLVGTRWKEGTLERKLWLAGYYSAVMSYMEPSSFIGKPEDSGRGYPARSVVNTYYNMCWLSGVRKTEPVARKLHRETLAKLLQEDEAAANAHQDKPPSTPRK